MRFIVFLMAPFLTQNLPPELLTVTQFGKSSSMLK